MGQPWFSFLSVTLDSRKAAKTQRETIALSENEIARIMVDVAFKIHSTLGPGLLESVYETVFFYELTNRGLKVRRQVAVPIVYAGLRFEARI